MGLGIGNHTGEDLGARSPGRDEGASLRPAWGALPWTFLVPCLQSTLDLSSAKGKQANIPAPHRGYFGRPHSEPYTSNATGNSEREFLSFSRGATRSG